MLPKYVGTKMEAGVCVQSKEKKIMHFMDL